MIQRYKLTRKSRNDFSFDLLSKEDNILFSSFTYRLKSSALTAIKSCIKHAKKKDNYYIEVSQGVSYYFKLKGGGDNTLAESQMYHSEEKVVEAIKSSIINSQTPLIDFIDETKITSYKNLHKKETNNPLEKYFLYFKKDGVKTKLNPEAFEMSDEAFKVFTELFDKSYGDIQTDDNLISIHTGGWSENESLINDLKETAWWFINHSISKKGGHYYFDTNQNSDKKWKVVKT